MTHKIIDAKILKTKEDMMEIMEKGIKIEKEIKMEYENWISRNRTQLEQDFIDEHEDMFEEFCRARYEGGKGE